MEEIASLIEHGADDDRLAKYMLDLLLKHYPGHTWMVQVFGKDGYATIRNPSISYKMGMRVIFPRAVKSRLIMPNSPLRSLSDLDYKVVTMAGEFLERFDIRRAKANPDQTQERWNQARFR